MVNRSRSPRTYSKLILGSFALSCLMACDPKFYFVKTKTLNSQDLQCSELSTSDIRNSCYQVQERNKALERVATDWYQQWPDLKWYVDEFYESLPINYISVASLHQVARYASQFQVVFSGDVHSDLTCVETHLKLALHLYKQSPKKMSLALEIPSYFQNDIDAYLAGEIDDHRFQEEVWAQGGYGRVGTVNTWPQWLKIFQLARVKNISIFAVDAARGRHVSLYDRDRQIAANIDQILQKHGPDLVLLTPIGNAHLAGRARLPSILGDLGIESFTFHTIATESLHWKLASVLGAENKLRHYAAIIDHVSAYLFSNVSLVNRKDALIAGYTRGRIL